MEEGGDRPAKTSAASLEERLLLPPPPPPPARTGGKQTGKIEWEKTYLDVLGVCCSAEVALVDRLLKPIAGVRAVTVVVPSRTVIVDHDPAAVSPSHIAKVLNKAGLEATVRSYGTTTTTMAPARWPSAYVITSGVLLLTSLLLTPLLPPLRWLSLAAACAGAPPMLRRTLATCPRLIALLDVNALMLLAVTGAALLGEYAEAGAIVFLFTAAEWLETLACAGAAAGMTSLLTMVPRTAVVAETGEVVGVGDVGVGTVVAVRAGEVVPVDGVVVRGRSEVDESSLTGESFPVPKEPMAQVWAGTVNLDGYIAVRTTAVDEDSTVARMQRLVEAAQSSRSRTQRLVDSCAKYYTPAVVAVAASVAVVPLVVVGAGEMRRWFQLALVLLVSACPCALVLSTPVATFCALLRAARMGVLIKGGDVLESLGEIRVAAFDKTGTITRGEFSVDGFRAVGDKVQMNQLLYWVSSIETKSGHPMATALVEYSQSKSIQPTPENVTEFRIYPGEGISGAIDGRQIFIGNRRTLARSSCYTGPEIMETHTKGASIGYVIVDGDLVGSFSLSDDCRTGAAEAIRELRSMGIKSVMLTGDSRAAATRAHQQLGGHGVLDELHCELLPADKVRLVRELQQAAAHGGGATLMVGDGMNDAAALAAADVGVAMGVSGSSSAAAMETSHATLMSGDLLRVPAAVALGRRARRTIAVNVAASVAAKAAVLGLAAATSWRPVLWAAVLADVGTCLLVVLHSMTLLREEPVGTGRRRRRVGEGEGNEHEACRATARSLAMRSQLAAGASSGGGAAESAQRQGRRQGGGTGTKGGCGCCPKPSSKPFEQEHAAAVVIDIPASHSDATGCCSAGGGGACSAPASTTGTSVNCASRGCCGGKGEGDDRVSARTSCCSNGGGEAARDSCKKAGKGCNARCCPTSSGK